MAMAAPHPKRKQSPMTYQFGSAQPPQAKRSRPLRRADLPEPPRPPPREERKDTVPKVTIVPFRIDGGASEDEREAPQSIPGVGADFKIGAGITLEDFNDCTKPPAPVGLRRAGDAEGKVKRVVGAPVSFHASPVAEGAYFAPAT